MQKENIFSIRPAKPEDSKVILKFIRELAYYENLLKEVVATEALVQQHIFSEHKTAYVIIGEINGKAVSFALYFKNFSTFLGKPGLYLEDLYVSPQYRNNGFGTAMISYLAKLVVNNNYGRLEWWVLDSNTAALKFYQSIGAIPMTDWTVQRLTGAALQKIAELDDSSL